MEIAIQQGEFHDSAWITELLQLFARYYFHALDAYEHKARNTPVVWRYAFDAAHLPGFIPVQHLMVGVNAHINYDLVLSITNLLSREWSLLSDAARQERYEDHTHVNQIIARTLDQVQEQVIERWAPEMNLVDVLMGPLDEWLTTRWIFRWREAVWENALQMVAAPLPPQREALRRRLSRQALQRSQAILYQPARLIEIG